MNPIYTITFLAESQSGFYWSSMQTAESTICTAAGGEVNPLIYVIAPLSILPNAYYAYRRIGNALSSYPLASSAIFLI